MKELKDLSRPKKLTAKRRIEKALHALNLLYEHYEEHDICIDDLQDMMMTLDSDLIDLQEMLK